MLALLLKIFAPTVLPSNNTIVLYEDNFYQTLAIYSDIAVNVFLENKLEIKSVRMLLDHELLRNNVFDPENKYSLPYIPYPLSYWQLEINPECMAICLIFDKTKFEVDRKKLGTSFILIFEIEDSGVEYFFTTKNVNGVISIVDQGIRTDKFTF